MTANDGDDAKTHALLVTPLFSRSSLPRASSFSPRATPRALRAPPNAPSPPACSRRRPRAGAGAPARRARSHSHASRFPFTAALCTALCPFRFKTVRSTPTSRKYAHIATDPVARCAAHCEALHPNAFVACTSHFASRTSQESAPAKSRARAERGFSLRRRRRRRRRRIDRRFPWWVCFLPPPPPPDAPHERRRAVVCRFVHGDAARVNQPPTRLQAPVPRRPVGRGAAILFLRAPRVFAQNVHQVRARLQKAASGGPVQGARAVRVHGRVARGVPARVRDERAQSGKVPVARQAQAERQTVARARFFCATGRAKTLGSFVPSAFLPIGASAEPRRSARGGSARTNTTSAFLASATRSRDAS